MQRLDDDETKTNHGINSSIYEAENKINLNTIVSFQWPDENKDFDNTNHFKFTCILLIENCYINKNYTYMIQECFI